MIKKTIKFSNEYEFEGKKITNCELRKPKLKDRNQALKVARANGFDEEETEALIYANLTDLPLEFVNECIYQDDYNKITGAYLDFLGLDPSKLIMSRLTS
ncbi:MAG: phage tail assembly protein [Oligoflexales bacterium]